MRWLIVFLLSLVASMSLADDREVRMDCTVTNQTVIRSNDGKPEIYTSYKGQFQTGDSLIFSIRKLDNDKIQIELSNYKREDYKNVLYAQSKVSRIENHLRGNGAANWIYVSEDKIIFNDLFGSFLKLSRYYKNDFHGISNGNLWVTDNIEALIATLDCRMIKDNFDEILKSFD